MECSAHSVMLINEVAYLFTFSLNFQLSITDEIVDNMSPYQKYSVIGIFGTYW